MRRRIAISLGVGFALLASGCGGDDGDDGTSDDDGDGGGRGSWEALDDIPAGPIQETAVVALDDSIYVIGGIDGNINTRSGVLRYDTAAGEWSEAPALPFAVHHVNASVVDGAIYVTGALRADFAQLGVVWSWTPGDAAWLPGPEMPVGTERGASAVGVVDDLIVVAGGLANNRSVALVSTYDPASGEWDDSPPDLPVALDHGVGQTADGVFYVVGGRGPGIFDAVYAYVDGEWQERAPMPTARGGMASGVIDGKIVVIGGEGNRDAKDGVFPQTELYDPAADDWTRLTDMPTPRHGMGAASVGGALYVPGGANEAGFGAVATHEVLRLP